MVDRLNDDYLAPALLAGEFQEWIAMYIVLLGSLVHIVGIGGVCRDLHGEARPWPKGDMDRTLELS